MYVCPELTVGFAETSYTVREVEEQIEICVAIQPLTTIDIAFQVEFSTASGTAGMYMYVIGICTMYYTTTFYGVHTLFRKFMYRAYSDCACVPALHLDIYIYIYINDTLTKCSDTYKL